MDEEYTIEYWQEENGDWGVTEAGASLLEDVAGTDTLSPDPAENDNHAPDEAANDNTEA